MAITFLNPLGWWALSGIPIILLIHTLQRRPRLVPVSTLFLLQNNRRESISGRRFDKLLNSIPLWLQLLLVCLLTWLLLQPRLQQEHSTQQIAIVIDSSGSMSVFKDSLISTLEKELPTLKGLATNLDIYLFESQSQLPLIYRGSSIDEALRALSEKWNPTQGAIDPIPALRLARSRVRSNGHVIYATDTPTGTLPYDVSTLAIGRPIANCGWAGLRIETHKAQTTWSAILRNYGQQPITRNWHIQYPDGSQTQPRPITLNPGTITPLSGAFPAEVERLILRLDADEFLLDDAMPIIIPQPKVLTYQNNLSSDLDHLATRLSASIPALQSTSEATSEATPNASQTTPAADFLLQAYDPLQPAAISLPAIVFLRDPSPPGKLTTGTVIAASHPLTAGLNWQPLFLRNTLTLEATADDQVLLQQEDRPLILLRQINHHAEGSTQTNQFQLIFNFDPRHSNLLKLPALAVMLQRFIEFFRTSKIAPESLNLKTRQSFQLTHSATTPLAITHQGLDLKIRKIDTLAASFDSFQTPAEPGFLTIAQDKTPLLQAAIAFDDPREADFTKAGKVNDLKDLDTQQLTQLTVPAPFQNLLLLSAIGLLLLTWHFSQRSKNKNRPPLPPSPPKEATN